MEKGIENFQTKDVEQIDVLVSIKKLNSYIACIADICNKKCVVKLRKNFNFKTEQSYKCFSCNKTFCKKIEKEIHERIHRNKIRFKCNICRRDFKLKYNYIKHKQIHVDKKHMCNICKINFSTNYSLQRHYKNIHLKNLKKE